MATIQTTINLADRMSGPIKNIISSVDSMITSMDHANAASQNIINTAALRTAHSELGQARAQLDELSASIDRSRSAQENLNRSFATGGNAASGLTGKMMGLVSAYAGLQGIKAIAGASDNLATMRARVDLMNDGAQSTNELMQMIYNSAQDARGSFDSMGSVVARFGNNAKDAFGSSAEVVQFASIIQKQMKIAGATTEEAANAELQLSQALGSGVLRGDELNSIFEQAPNLIQSIADYMNVPIGQIRSMAAEGKLSADIVKNAVFASQDQVNARFARMPMTWGDVVTTTINHIQNASQPLLNLINAIANNWDTIKPIAIGVAGAIGAYATALVVLNTVQGIQNGLQTIAAARTAMTAAVRGEEAEMTFMETGAQYGYNAALLACPLTWIIAATLAAAAAVVLFAGHIAYAGGVATTTFGVICGWVNVLIRFFINLGKSFFSIMAAIGGAAGATSQNINIAFHNALGRVASEFYSLRANALSVIADIADGLSKLPFVKLDVSGLRAAAGSFRSKASKAKTRKQYVSIAKSAKGAYLAQGGNAFKGGWASAAYANGAAWGDRKWATIAPNVSSVNKTLKQGVKSFKAAPSKATTATKGTKGSRTSASRGTGSHKMSSAVQSAASDLSLIRKLAEKRAVGKVLNATVKLDMKGMKNYFNNKQDIDGFVDVVVDKITTGLNEKLDTSAEGVGAN
ncbi:tape measure protein [Eubacterium pyruvativorans]|uniref:tape measure protein n=1 Tax=Eubacterium pyruvativorans TaxID=155865 RepID=UPI0008831426|nr:tape measure protein [Eubacterium pyruvativorans]SDF30507.1 tape measure domain-containing protein [Eubacterium pyruvativorans]